MHPSPFKYMQICSKSFKIIWFKSIQNHSKSFKYVQSHSNWFKFIYQPKLFQSFDIDHTKKSKKWNPCQPRKLILIADRSSWINTAGSTHGLTKFGWCLMFMGISHIRYQMVLSPVLDFRPMVALPSVLPKSMTWISPPSSNSQKESGKDYV